MLDDSTIQGRQRTVLLNKEDGSGIPLEVNVQGHDNSEFRRMFGVYRKHGHSSLKWEALQDLHRTQFERKLQYILFPLNWTRRVILHRTQLQHSSSPRIDKEGQARQSLGGKVYYDGFCDTFDYDPSN
jgi:hypothetical protein